MEFKAEFKGKLGNYKIVETEDKTKTVWSEFFDENCHNLSGAYEETIHNYIRGCQIKEQILNDKGFSVLDVGFGVGIGLLALMNQLKECQKDGVELTGLPLFYTSLELDEELFLWAVKENLPELSLTKKDNYYFGESKEGLKIKIFIGDGRETIPQGYKAGLISPLSAIFQDPFSPKKNPTLWTTEWFNDLKEMSKTEVYLSTYSSSISIRKSLIAAEWTVENHKGFGTKRTMTVARLQGETDPELKNQLERSPSLELRDNLVKIE